MATNPLIPPPPYAPPTPEDASPLIRSLLERQRLGRLGQTVPMELEPTQGIPLPQSPATPAPHELLPAGMAPTPTLESPVLTQEDAAQRSPLEFPIFPIDFAKAAEQEMGKQLDGTPLPGMPPTQRSGLEQAIIGMTSGVGDLMNFLNTPTGVAFSALGPGLQALSRSTSVPAHILLNLTKMGFTTMGIQQVIDAAPAAQRSFEQGNIQEGTRQLTHVLMGSGMAIPGATVGYPEGLTMPRVPEGIRNLGEQGKATMRGAANLGQRVLADEGGYMTLEFLDSANRQLARQDIQGILTRHMEGENIRLPEDVKVHIVVKAQPSGGVGQEASTALQVVDAFNLTPDRIGYYIQQPKGKRIRITEEEFKRRYAAPIVPERPPVVVPQPPPNQAAEGRRLSLTEAQVLGREQLPGRVGEMRPGVSPLPRTVGGRISTRTTIGGQGGKVRRTPEDLLDKPDLRRYGDKAPVAAPDLAAPEAPVPEAPATLPSEQVPAANTPLEQVNRMRAGAGLPPREAPAAPVVTPVEEAAPVPTPEAPAPTAPTPSPTGAQPSPMEMMLMAMMESNRLQAEYNRLMSQWLMQGGRGAPPAPAPSSAPMAPTPATPTPPASTAPTGAAANTAGAAAVRATLAKRPELAEATKTGATASRGPRRFREVEGEAATGERPYRTVEERDAYYANLLQQKRTPKEAIFTKDAPVGAADRGRKMVKGTPEKTPEAVEPRTKEEFTEAVRNAADHDGPPVRIRRIGLGERKPQEGYILYEVENSRGKPTGTYAFMPDGYSGEPWIIPAKEIAFIGQATHEMNIPRFGTRQHVLGIEVAAQAPANRLKGPRVRLADGTLGVKVGEVQGGMKDVRNFILNLKDNAAGDPALLEVVAKYEAELAEQGFIKLDRVALDSGKWVDVLPEEVTIISEAKTISPSKYRPKKPRATPKLAAQTKKAQKDVEKRMAKAGGERAQPETPIEERLAGQGISAEAIDKATGRTRRDPFTEYQGKSKEQLKHMIAETNKQGKELLAEAAAKAKAMPGEAAALRQKARELSLDVADMKKALEAALSHREIKAREAAAKAAADEARKKKKLGAIETPATPIPPPPGSRMSASEFRGREGEKKLSPEEAKKAIEEMRKGKK